MQNIAPHIEHTLLRQDATTEQVARLCEEAVVYGFLGVCVNPVHVPQAAKLLAGRARVVSVVGFPLGAGSVHSDVAEAAWLVTHGCDEVDWVVPVGLALSGDFRQLAERAAAVREAAPRSVLKVILETGHWTSATLAPVCEAVLQCGPEFLKTSTGFGPRGASVEDVHELLRIAAGRAQVKASGGIRDMQSALALLAAGATRLGTSSGVQLCTPQTAVGAGATPSTY